VKKKYITRGKGGAFSVRTHKTDRQKGNEMGEKKGGRPRDIRGVNEKKKRHFTNTSRTLRRDTSAGKTAREDARQSSKAKASNSKGG